jgi:baculoviral IAP repeat-containing protein 7/8
MNNIIILKNTCTVPYIISLVLFFFWISDSTAASEATERSSSLQQENDRLRNMRTCQQCRSQPVGVIFLPCGHIVACTTCAPNIRRCTRCDTVIRATANVYFS